MALLTASRARRFTKAEFHQMHDFGFFIDQRVELIDGEILEMPGPDNPDCVSTECVAEVQRGLFGPTFWVRVQMPLDLSPFSEPQPDVAVVAGAHRTHKVTPSTALLLTEVSDTTLATDQGSKGSLDAAAGIGDCWIVNLNDRKLEIYRNPIPDPAAPFGFSYADLMELDPTDFATPLALPTVRILVSQLLP